MTAEKGRKSRVIRDGMRAQIAWRVVIGEDVCVQLALAESPAGVREEIIVGVQAPGQGTGA